MKLKLIWSTLPGMKIGVAEGVYCRNEGKNSQKHLKESRLNWIMREESRKENKTGSEVCKRPGASQKTKSTKRSCSQNDWVIYGSEVLESLG